MKQRKSVLGSKSPIKNSPGRKQAIKNSPGRKQAIKNNPERKQEISNSPDRKQPSKYAKSRKVFKISLLTYIGILTLLSIVVLIVLWNKLSNYQKSVEAPENSAAHELDDSLQKAQEYFEGYADNLEIDDWVNLWKENCEVCYDSDEALKKAFTALLGTASQTRYRAVDYSPQVPSFVIKLGADNLAHFSLIREGEQWKMDKVSWCKKGRNATVTIPSDAKLFINGVEATNAFVSEGKSNIQLSRYEEDLINPINYLQYEVDGFWSDATFEVRTDLNMDVFGNEDFMFCYSPKDDVKADYQSKAEGFVKALLDYSSGAHGTMSENRNRLFGYVAADSEAYRVINESYNGLLWVSHRPNVPFDIEVQQVIVLADNCFAVDVAYTKTEELEYFENGVYRVFFLDKGNGMKVYQFEGI